MNTSDAMGNRPQVPTEYLDINLVGGAVRDLLLGVKPSDRDWVIVGAGPIDIERLLRVEGFEKVGAHFPVFLHPLSGEEYALARTERKVGEGYHGFEVVFDSDVTIEEDLARRDFTINAMAYPVKPNQYSPANFDPSLVIDPYGGKTDLQNKILRHTSDAFTEDPLRVIRLARFAAKLEDFTVAPETLELAQKMVKDGQLNELPKERFVAEIDKVLRTIDPHRIGTFFLTLHELGCQRYVDFFRSWDLVGASRQARHVATQLSGDLHGANILAIMFSDDNEWVGKTFNAHVKRAHECYRHIDDPWRSKQEALVFTMQQMGWGASTNAFGLLCSALTAKPSRISVTTILRASHATLPLNSMGEQLRTSGMNGKMIGTLIQGARMDALINLMSNEF